MAMRDINAAMAEPRLGDDDWQARPVDAHYLDEEERRALKILAEGSSHGFTESTLVARRVCAETRTSLIRRGLASAQTRTLLSGDRAIALSWIGITAAGRRAIEARFGVRGSDDRTPIGEAALP
jgi:hypothetical protein